MTKLPRTQQGYDSIWVIVDRLMKSSHFLPVKTKYGVAKYARVYLEEIMRLPMLTSQIGDLSLCPYFGDHYKKCWEPNLTLVQSSTLRLTINL